MRRDLCTLADVTSYVPAYESNETTDAKLAQLVESESQLIHDETGREIIGKDEADATRTFEIGVVAARLRQIFVGDLNGLYSDVVTILNRDGSVAQVIDADAVVPLYEGERSPTRDWEPITELYFPWGFAGSPILLAQWQVLEITGRWGFPEVPAFIREACAKRVILRYVSDVAAAGTSFADAVDQGNLNLAAMFESAQDALAQLRGRVVIA
jgi:hypothetical protein